MFVYSLSQSGTNLVRYIGVTSKTLQSRLKGHIKDAKSGGSTYKCNWIRSVDYDIVIKQLEFLDPLEYTARHISDREVFWIAHFKSIGVPLVNGTLGGLPSYGFSMTEEVRRRIGEQSLERNTGEDHWTYGLEKENHPSFGTKRSPETRRKQSEALSGREFSEAHRKSLSDNHSRLSGEMNPFFGKEHSQESKLKMSSAHIGKTISNETKKKMSISQTGSKKPWNATSSHTRWHTNKGVSKPETCKHCVKDLGS